MTNKTASRRNRRRGVGAISKHLNTDVAPQKMAYGYVRVSTEEQADEGYSVSAQKRRLKAFCEAKEWTLVYVFADEGRSARGTKQREEYNRMMSALRTGDVMLIWKIDRIHRNARNFARMVDELDRRQIDFCSINESWDTSTATGRFAMDLIVRIAQLESEQTGERTSEGLREAARQGKQYLGQRAPYGYNYSEPSGKDGKNGKGRWIIDVDEANIVEFIFQKYGMYSGREWSAGDIAKHLKWCRCEAAYKRALKKNKDAPKRGGCYGCYKVRHILNNPAYVGYFSYGGEIHQGDQQPIIDRRAFEKAQERRWYYKVVLPEVSKE